MTKSSIEEMLALVQMDEAARLVFLSMSREEQLLAILGMEAYIRGEVAKLQKNVAQINQELGDYRMQFAEFRKQRDMDNKRTFGDLQGDGHQSTTQKIIMEVTKQLNSRFDWSIWFRDKVLPSMVSLLALVLLWMIFQTWTP